MCDKKPYAVTETTTAETPPLIHACGRYDWRRDQDLIKADLEKLKAVSPKAYDKCEGSPSVLLGCFTVDMIAACPEFARRWPPPTGDDLATVLLKHPEIFRLCDWGRLEQKDWQQLLSRCPQCAAYCPTLDWQDEDGWALLLSQCPEYAASCKVLDSMSGDQWMLILLKQPSLCDRCNWRKLTGRNWARILKRHPEWEVYCRFEGFSCEDWAAMLCALPKYADKCPESILTSSARALVIAKRPELMNDKVCRWLANGILPSDWARILWHQPTLAECCKCWDAFLPDDWLGLLIRQPGFQERCKIGSKMLECLPKKSIVRLLKKRPEVSGCFPSDKLAAKLRCTGGSDGHGHIGGTCMAW